MSPLYEAGLEAIRWLQENYPQLDTALAVVSQFGRFEFFLAIVPLIYWCIHKRFGKHLAYLLALSNLTNSVLKHAFRQPRPFWLDESVGLATETSYGIPSNHVQTAAALYPFLVYWMRRRWVWLVAAFAILLMALSRIYLGVHFPHDAAGGLLIGLVVLGGYLIWLHFFQDTFRNRILGQRLLVVLAVPLVFALIYGLIRLLTGAATMNVTWSEFIPVAERTAVDDVTSGLAMLLGMGIGFILEATRIHFVVDGSLLKRAARYLLGIAVTIAIWRGLALILPEDPLWLALPLRFIRYWLASMWVAYYAPAVFIWLRLAEASPEPEVQLTISNGSIMRG
ncbi:MAG: phosphatase PAP2 family protein [Anaerolineae bacterium]|nr:phosphatase PAP2 family protein [Anaerolineae bacterium]